jgi:hypothetical protein
MRLASRTLALAIAVGPVSVASCGDDSTAGDGGETPDGSTDAPPGDGGAEDAVGDGARDAFTDAAPDGLPEDAPPDAPPAAAFESSTDGDYGAFLLTADATLIPSGPGVCAAASALVVAPSETPVGHTINLYASGIDPNNQNSDVTLTWMATGSAGSLAGSMGASNTFRCAAPGAATITVTAAILDAGASCPGIGSLSATVTCDPP